MAASSSRRRERVDCASGGGLAILRRFAVAMTGARPIRPADCFLAVEGELRPTLPLRRRRANVAAPTAAVPGQLCRATSVRASTASRRLRVRLMRAVWLSLEVDMSPAHEGRFAPTAISQEVILRGAFDVNAASDTTNCNLLGPSALLAACCAALEPRAALESRSQVAL